ncbi:MAG: hypothetical protein ACE5KZ_10615 [Candidatus Scalinduaceae bacterium]
MIINIMMTAFIVFFAFSCGKVEKYEKAVTKEEEISSKIPYKSETKFKMHMKSLEDFYDNLEKAIDRQRWEEIREYAIQMKNTSPVVLTGNRREELPQDFIMMDTSFHLHTLALVEASESREMVKLNIEFEKVKQSCDDCHEKYKKKES